MLVCRKPTQKLAETDHISFYCSPHSLQFLLLLIFDSFSDARKVSSSENVLWDWDICGWTRCNLPFWESTRGPIRMRYTNYSIIKTNTFHSCKDDPLPPPRVCRLHKVVQSHQHSTYKPWPTWIQTFQCLKLGSEFVNNCMLMLILLHVVYLLKLYCLWSLIKKRIQCNWLRYLTIMLFALQHYTSDILWLNGCNSKTKFILTK